MKAGIATYYADRHLLHVDSGSWTITGRVPSLRHAASGLSRFGFNKTPWESVRPGVWQCKTTVKSKKK